MDTTGKKRQGEAPEGEVYLALFGGFIQELTNLEAYFQKMQVSASRLKELARSLWGYRHLIEQSLAGTGITIPQLGHIDNLCRELHAARVNRDALLKAEAERGIGYELQGSADGGGFLTLGKHVFLLSTREFQFLNLLTDKNMQDKEGWVTRKSLTLSMRTSTSNVRAIKNRLKTRLSDVNALYAYLISSRPGGYKFLGVLDGGSPKAE